MIESVERMLTDAGSLSEINTDCLCGWEIELLAHKALVFMRSRRYKGIEKDNLHRFLACVLAERETMFVSLCRAIAPCEGASTMLIGLDGLTEAVCNCPVVEEMYIWNHSPDAVPLDVGDEIIGAMCDWDLLNFFSYVSIKFPLSDDVRRIRRLLMERLSLSRVEAEK